MANFKGGLNADGKSFISSVVASKKPIIINKLLINGVEAKNLVINRDGNKIKVSGQYDNMTMADNRTLNKIDVRASVEGVGDKVIASFTASQGDVVPPRSAQPWVATYTVNLVVSSDASVGMTYKVQSGIGKYEVPIGDGLNSEYTISHNLGTRSVIVQLYQSGQPYEDYLFSVYRQNENQIKVVANRVIKKDEFRVVIVG